MDEITLRNFRCFREEQTARLAPLTLLVGENSTGKTSFMAMIRALWDVAYAQRVPDFKEKPYDLGSFDEIAHHRGARGSRAEEFGAALELTPAAHLKQRGVRGVPLRFSVTFRQEGTAPVPKTRRLTDGTASFALHHDPNQRYLTLGVPDKSWRFNPPKSWIWFFSQDTNDDPFLGLIFYASQHFLQPHRNPDNDMSLVPLSESKVPNDTQRESLRHLAREGELCFLTTDVRPYASAPVRSRPRRTYDPARPSRDPEGDYIPMYLADAYFRNEAAWEALRERLERFGQDAGLFDEITIRPLGKKDSDPFQLQVRKFSDRRKGPPRNLIDVGYGVSQILPVITELLRVDAPPMFLLQQPEVHLHPSAQAALGSLFCRVASPERQLVVETHSDHLLGRVRMDIRDKVTDLTPDDVSILYFERGELDVRIHSLGLDQDGNVVGAPDSYRRFFMEETTRSLGL